MIFVKAFLMSILPFWRVDLPQQALNFGDMVEITEYKNGKPSPVFSIDQNDHRYRTLTIYLTDQKWRYDATSYAPEVLVKGNGITLNCRKMNAVIYFVNENNESTQLSSDASPTQNCGLPATSEQ